MWSMGAYRSDPVHHHPRPQCHGIGWAAKPLEPERCLGTTSLLQTKAVKDLRPGSLLSIDTTTNSVEQILLRCLTHHGRYMLVGEGGSEGCQGPRGCHHGTSASVPVDKVVQWLWKDFLSAFQIFLNS